MDITQTNDEDFIFIARYSRIETLSVPIKKYIKERLDSLGYTIEYGCCGTNILRMKKNERQSHL